MQTIRNPIESIRGVMKDAMSPDVDIDTRKQAAKMLTKYCEESDPTRAVEVRDRKRHTRGIGIATQNGNTILFTFVGNAMIHA